MNLNEKSIFNTARKIVDDDSRDEYLRRVCANDHDALIRIRELIAEHNEATGFLKSPLADLIATQSISESSELIGSQIGPYKLLQEIGEGGMGTVFMAEQETPVRRRVALKIVKAGMDSKQVVARFEAERQALAMMDHPGIAQVFDAGTTDLGRPFFVMELIKGMPITQYCDEKKLSVKQRLKLFKSVCNAMQHAHQKGIMHRDLKPSNILVAEYDDQAIAKIIDFGLAKALHHRLTEKTMFTQLGQIVGTLEYMSPEQSKMNQLDVDMRTDIYSLGVLLYELLSGTTPFDKQRLRAAAFDQILKIIREEEPPKPSIRLGTSDSSAEIAASRGTEPRKLSGLLHGELDWIAMKALEKDRSRRYQTADGFARDIERHLNNEVVEACPPSLSYIVNRFVRRNRAAMSVAGTFAALLLVGITITTLLLIRTMGAEKDLLAQRDAKDVALKAAEQARNLADIRADESRRSMYIAHMQQIQLEWETNDLARINELLDLYRSPGSGKDLRGWEWFYWDRMCHLDLRTLEGHDKAVNCVVFSPDGSQVASAGEDGTVRLWCVATGEQIQLFEGHQGAVRCIDFFPDRSLLASGGLNDNTVILWDMDSGNAIKRLKHSGPISSLAFSPDGKLLGVAATGRDSERKIWNTTAWQLKHTLESPRRKPVFGVTFSPDSSQFVCVGSPEIEFWDAHGGKLIREMTGHKTPEDNNMVFKAMTSIMFSPDGSFFVTGSTDQKIKTWDSQSGVEIQTFSGHESAVNHVSIDAKGILLASAGSDNSIKLWHPTTRAPDSDGAETIDSAIRTLKGHRRKVLCVAIGPDGRRIASASADGTVKIWDAGQRLDLMPLPTKDGHYMDVDFLPKGKRIAASVFRGLSTRKKDNLVDLCDAETWQGNDELLGHTGWIFSTDFDAGGKIAATYSRDQTVKLWDLETGGVLRTIGDFDIDMRRVWPELEISGDGKHLVTNGPRVDLETNQYSSELTVWEVKTGRKLEAYSGRKFTFGPIDAILAYEHRGPDSPAIEIRIIDTYTGKILQSWETAQPVVDLAFSQDGQLLAASLGESQQIVVWNVIDGAEILRLEDAGKEIAFVSDATRILSLSKMETLNVWSAETGDLMCSTKVHPGILRMVVSPDSFQVAFMGRSIIRILDILPTEPASQENREVRSMISRLLLMPFEVYRSSTKSGWTFAHPPLRKAAALNIIRELNTVNESVRRRALSLVEDLYQPSEEAAIFAVSAGGLIEGARPEDRQQALEWAETAYQIAPEDWTTQTVLGDALYCNGKYGEALKRFEMSRELVEVQEPREKPTLLAFIAMTQWQLGKKEKAKETLQEANKIAPLRVNEKYFQEANDLINGGNN